MSQRELVPKRKAPCGRLRQGRDENAGGRGVFDRETRVFHSQVSGQLEKPRHLILINIHFWQGTSLWEQTTHTRNPLLLFELFGLLLFRFDRRALFSLLFHDPPRSARSLTRSF